MMKHVIMTAKLVNIFIELQRLYLVHKISPVVSNKQEENGD